MASQNDASKRETIWTPANVVTVVRICFVPVFVIAILAPWPEWITFWSSASVWKPWIAAFIFALLAATDGVDGYLARSRNEVTDFGKFIDPLADKILVTAALLVLIELGVLPSWIALIILAREFIVSGIRMLAATKGVVIAASWYGKAKTVTQIIAIILFIIKDSVIVSNISSGLVLPLFVVSWLVMIAAVILTIGSMLDYFVKAKDLLGIGKQADSQDAIEPDESADEEIASALEVVAHCKEKGITVATAESLTGGLIAAALTEVPGSSAVLRGSVVSYATEIKAQVLGVEAEVLEQQGAVSAQVASEMAEGARTVMGADYAVSATGIAGPDGDGSDTPVGTVWIGLSAEGVTEARVFCFEGDREAVRKASVDAALAFLAEVLQR